VEEIKEAPEKKIEKESRKKNISLVLKERARRHEGRGEGGEPSASGLGGKRGSIRTGESQKKEEKYAFTLTLGKETPFLKEGNEGEYPLPLD